MDQNPQDQTPVTDEQTSPVSSNVKQQIAESIKGGKNILVTVDSNPTVDELAAALGLTFLLSKLDKHASAVFSGEIPPAMEFLDPDATFESSVDSLRDFIIALDREKADKLRYKVEDEVVKIFITPYRTVLKKDDFQFSQGDFNVDVVVALGVEKRDNLDKAIIAHGRILHDATVITINIGDISSGLGALDWNDPNASSISEMLMSISESFGSGLLDEQISTAFLTGIVAATNRFSNEKTSPKVMTMAAQLMAAGANQQLIATNLRREGMISEQVRQDNHAHKDDGEMLVEHEQEKPKQDTPQNKPQPSQNSGPARKDNNTSNKKPPKNDGGQKQGQNQNASQNRNQSQSQPPQKPQSNISRVHLQSAEPSQSADSAGELKKTLDLANQKVEAVPPQAPQAPLSVDAPLHSITDVKSEDGPVTRVISAPAPQLAPTKADDRPTFGGTLNATTAQAAQNEVAQTFQEGTTNNATLEHMTSESSNDEAVAAARRAVEDATSLEPFNPAGQPREDIAAQSLPLPSLGAVPAPQPNEIESVVAVPEVSQVPELPPLPQSGGFSTEAVPMPQAVNQPEPFPAPATPQVESPGVVEPIPLAAPSAMDASPVGGIPPLPPMPPMPVSTGDLPPLPPMPGQTNDPAASFQPQVSPDFMQNQPRSQNYLTEQGEAIAAQQAEKTATRQAKIDERTEQYDAAVEKNQELKAQAADPNDHATFPLPPQY